MHFLQSGVVNLITQLYVLIALLSQRGSSHIITIQLPDFPQRYGLSLTVHGYTEKRYRKYRGCKEKEPESKIIK